MANDGTGHKCSGPTPRPSREVAITLTVVVSARTASTSPAAASNTCSQLSNTINSRRPDRACTTLSVDRPTGWGVTPKAAATTSGERRRIAQRGQLDQPHPVGEPGSSSAATCNARRVLPTPPTPVKVTTRWALIVSMSSSTAARRPTKLVVWTGRFPGTASKVRKWQIGLQAWRPDLEHALDAGQVPEAMVAQITQIDTRHQRRGRGRHQDLTAVPGAHYPGGPVQHRTEVILPATLGLTCGNAHAHRQPQPPLGSHGGVDRSTSRAEHGAHPVPGVLEQPAVMSPIAARSTSSCAANATRIASGSDSHDRVEPSISVNKNVIVPDGRSPMNYLQLTAQLSHNPAHHTASGSALPADPDLDLNRPLHPCELRVGPIGITASWIPGPSSQARPRRTRWQGAPNTEQRDQAHARDLLAKGASQAGIGDTCRRRYGRPFPRSPSASAGSASLSIWRDCRFGGCECFGVPVMPASYRHEWRTWEW